MLHRSDSRFSIGVPVRANRWRARIRLAARVMRVAGFLMYCASSKMQHPNERAAIASTSTRSVSYEVTSTS